jgi:hypothetical protein
MMMSALCATSLALLEHRCRRRSVSSCGTPLRRVQEERVAALDEIERHGLAHDAEPDESDVLMSNKRSILPRQPGSLAGGCVVTGAGVRRGRELR